MPVDFDDDPHGRCGEELSDALRRTADGFRPDTPALVASGHTRGRRLRRRRTAVVTAAVAAVAAAGVGGALAAAGGASGTSGHGGGVASAPERPAATTKQDGSRPEALTAKQVEELFVSLLPKTGTVSGVSGRGTGQGIPYAHAVYDDGHGKAAVEVGISAQGAMRSCPSPNPDPTTSCTVVPLRDFAGNSGTLVILKGYEYSDHRAETKDWIASFRTSTGAVVELSEWNSPQEKDAALTRPEPPLNTVQITGIVTSPRWREVVDALPAPVKWNTSGKGDKGMKSGIPGPVGTTTPGAAKR